MFNFLDYVEAAKLAHRLGVGDRVIEKNHVSGWLLVAIVESELRNKLAFKGSTALLTES